MSSKSVAIGLMFFFILVGSAFAGVHDGSQSSYQSRLIDTSLNIRKVREIESKIEKSGEKDMDSISKLEGFSGKTLFWMGRVEKFTKLEEYTWMLADFSDNPEKPEKIWVYAKNTVRNIDFDRTGYTLGIKGNIVVRNNRLYYLNARSVVLIKPHDQLTYPRFMEKYHISDTFTINTPQGIKKMQSPFYPFILHRIYCHNPHYQWSLIQTIGKGIVYHSDRYGLDPLLITALLNIESAFDVDAVSSAGAIGLGQLMPGTASSLGVNPHDVFQNIGGAVKYFYQQMNRWKDYPDKVELSLASYNAGPGAVSQYGGVPPYSETQNYIFFITFLRDKYYEQMKEYSPTAR